MYYIKHVRFLSGNRIFQQVRVDLIQLISEAYSYAYKNGNERCTYVHGLAKAVSDKNTKQNTQPNAILLEYLKIPNKSYCYDFLHIKEKRKTNTRVIIELKDKRPLSLLRPAVFPCFTTKLRTRS